MTKKRSVISIIFISLVWLTLTALFFVLPKADFSAAERRKLASFPDVSVQSVLSGSFMSEYEEYALDAFPFRDKMRTIKAVTVYDLLRQKDNNGIAVSDGRAAQVIYPTNEASVANFADRMKDIYDSYIAGTDCKAFVTVIPDKGFFTAEKNGVLSPDYDLIFDSVREALPSAEYVDITDTLGSGSYYATDTHWRQEKLFSTAEKLLTAMGAPSGEYEQTVVKEDFSGVYAGQSALALGPDKITICENGTTRAATLYNAETGETLPLYVTDKLSGRDAYDVYLDGASPVIVIDNPLCGTGRELVVFRDSFASSLTPLLIEGYSRVTLIDTRYMPSAMIGSFAEFSSQDVLFAYSTILINSSFSLR